MSVDSTNSRYIVQQEFKINAKTFEWKEFAEFLKSLRNLQIATSQSRPSSVVQNILTSCRILRRILTTSPSEPKTAIESLDFPDLNSEIIEASRADLVENLYLTLAALKRSQNPFAKFTENIVSADLGKEDEEPDIVLFVHKSAIELTKDWLSRNDLVAQVLSVSETKHSNDFYATGVLFGLPEQHIYTHSQMGDIKAQSSWVLSAQIVKAVAICIGPGSDSFDSKDYEPWPGCWPDAVIAEKPSTRELLHVDVEASWTPVRPIFKENENEASIDTAGAILTIDNRWVIFDAKNKFKPLPFVLDADSHFVEKNFGDLSPGDVLAIHYGKSSRDFLRLAARTYLTGKGRDFDSILAAVNAFKIQFREFAARENAQALMMNNGLERDFIKFWLRYINSDSAIAPESERNYVQLSKLSGVPNNLIDYKFIKDYRNAIQHAGNLARQERFNELSRNTEWRDFIVNGSYILNLTNAGSMLISPIKEIYTEVFTHPVSKLGLVYSSLGEILED